MVNLALAYCRGSKVRSLIGRTRDISDVKVITYPLIIGAPNFDHYLNPDFIIKSEQLSWHRWDWSEIFPEAIADKILRAY